MQGMPERTFVYERAEPSGAVHVFDASAMPWEETARPGLRLKTIRVDDAKGEFLGQIAFDPLVRSGIHQHQGVATSFVLEGSLTDYHGPVHQNEVGINLLGSTHDAIAYVPTVLVSKLEAPVAYPPRGDMVSGVHAGSFDCAFRNPDPHVAPEINVAIDAAARLPTGIAGLTRQLAFDYGGTGLARRLVQWHVRPETEVPAWRATDWVELWVRGGELQVGGERVQANCFVVVEPGATVRLASPFGAIAIVWAEGEESIGGGSAANLLGF